MHLPWWHFETPSVLLDILTLEICDVDGLLLLPLVHTDIGTLELEILIFNLRGVFTQAQPNGTHNHKTQKKKKLHSSII